VALVATLLVILGAAFAENPIRDAVSLGAVQEAHLEHSFGYLAIAPISAILDTITLLGARQHVSVILSLIIVYVAIRMWRVRRQRNSAEETPTRLLVSREAAYAGVFLLAILLSYAAALVLPRPMASLSPEASDVLIAVDFHSHTKYSHDGRPGWDPSDVRAWHRAAGFDVAYVSDHRTVDGAELGVADNPAEAGQGTMILQGLEAGWRGEHVNLLGAGRNYKGLTTADFRDVDEQALALASLIRNHEPIVIETLPGDLSKILPASGPGTAGIRAIEVVDGSPRGLDQTRIMRSRIVHLADSLNLAMVVGSDNHGWGRAAPGWTLLIVPGWRGMRTDSLEYAIEHAMRLGHDATRVVERRVAGELNGSSAPQLTLTLPLVTWGMLTTLSTDERVVWVIWIWVIVLALRATAGWRRRRRVRPVV
jgi:predicted metal-dependent phosphoesterase TrpH